MTACVLAFASLGSAQQAAKRSDDWLARADRVASEQPSWASPLVTASALIKQGYRFDFDDQVDGDGSATRNFGGDKGVRLIPADRIQLDIAEPGYVEQGGAGGHDGWNDVSVQVKYRLAAATASHGNHIVALLFKVSAPMRGASNSRGVAQLQPAIAAGKGWGRWDVQSSLALNWPAARRAAPVATGTWNTALQYRVGRRWWPEVEMNATRGLNGAQAGAPQVYLTPGLVTGRFALTHRWAVAAGAGVEVAASHNHAFAHRVIVTLRVPF